MSCRESKLFHTVVNNSNHILHQFLPPAKQTAFNLRKRAHNKELPKKQISSFQKNSLTGCFVNLFSKPNGLRGNLSTSVFNYCHVKNVDLLLLTIVYCFSSVYIIILRASLDACFLLCGLLLRLVSW